MTSMTASPPGPFLSVLGGFELASNGRPISLCAPGERLLGYLAVHGRGRSVRRSALADRLWHDAASDRAAGRLRSLLWRLPQADGTPLVECGPAGICLSAPVAVDLWQAEDQAQRLFETEPGPVSGPDIFTGDLLPDWSEDWLVIERESYRQTRLHALERASDQLRRAGEHSAALRAALAAVSCEPLRESAHRQVISVHLAEGNHAEALRQYQSFRRLLAAELGLPPSPAIRGLVAPLLGRPVDIIPTRRAAHAASKEHS
jgi:DNA-binding SARP family transcriptional activator